MSDEDPFNQFDPLARLYKARRSLNEAGARGEYVIPALRDVNRAIESIIEDRAARRAARDRGREREP